MVCPKYSLRFRCQIQGCSIDALIDDINILKMLSDNKNLLKRLCFKSDKKGTTILTGHLLSDNLKDAHVFILYRLRPIILKSIVLTEVECLSFPDEFELKIENEEEIRQAGLPNCKNFGEFAVIKPSCPDVGKEEIQQNLRVVASNTCDELEDSLYWVYLTNTVCDFEKGMLSHDSVKQFRLMWSAFNRLYNLNSSKKITSERKRIEKFAGTAIALEFFDEQMKKIPFSYLIQNLVHAQLYLKDKENVSKQLQKALQSYNIQEISKYLLLCLYAVRNSLFHGEAREEIELSRVCIKILSPLVKHVIKQWALDSDVCAESSDDESGM